MLSRNKTAVLVTILIATVIMLLSHGGSFSNDSDGYHHRTPVGTQTRNIVTSLKTPKHGKNELKRGPTLTKDVIDHVESFVFFVGYPRSGHSIVGSLMDAHPHMVIANEFMLFKNWKYFSERQRLTGQENPFFQNPGNLFNALYRRSIYDVEKGFRSETNTKKNYRLHVNYSWQGKFDRYITVIGDKSGTSTSENYLSSKMNHLHATSRS